eukprot:275056-Hanusia_phi.AAC.1
MTSLGCVQISPLGDAPQGGAGGREMRRGRQGRREQRVPWRCGTGNRPEAGEAGREEADGGGGAGDVRKRRGGRQGE